MLIKELVLYSSSIDKQKKFYREIMGFEIENLESGFQCTIGQSNLRFEKSSEKFVYHYCFLVPSNMFEEAVMWLRSRLDLIRIEGDRVVQHFDDWNADSVYFYDGDGNVAEFIVRHDLNHIADGSFVIDKLINVNEIGLPTNEISGANSILSAGLGTSFYTGDYERFGTHGDKEGLFLLINNQVKKVWFPTNVPIQSSPFRAQVVSFGNMNNVNFDGVNVDINRINNSK